MYEPHPISQNRTVAWGIVAAGVIAFIATVAVFWISP